MTRSSARVFVVDDEESVRKSLVRLLSAAGYRVEAFASAAEFLARPGDAEVGCVVLDVRLPDLDGLELQRRLGQADRPLSIVFITGYGDIPMSVRAMRDGAVDFLSKPVDQTDLLGAVSRGLEKAARESADLALAREAKALLARLTPREHDVLLHVLAGEMNKQIASALGVAEKTIKVHRGRVMQKLGVRSVADLVRLCERAGVRVP